MTKYDDADYHQGAADAAGQPTEQAFTHIGLYFGWLIRRGFHRPGLLTDEDLSAVMAGEMTGSDLSDELDGKLMSDMMTPEGRRFTDFYYAAYLDDYGRVFAAEPDYGVVDDAASYARITPVVDRAYETWVSEGRPDPAPEDPNRLIETPEFARGPGVPDTMTAAELDAYMDDFVSRVPVEMVRIDEIAIQPVHKAPELERFVGDRLGVALGSLDSVGASQFGSSKLNRGLKRLGVRPRDATVVSTIQGSGEKTVMIDVYSVPGINRERLEAEFAGAIHRPSPRPWQPTEIAGRRVLVAEGREFIAIYWAVDGLVFHLAASAGVDLTPLVAQLGES